MKSYQEQVFKGMDDLIGSLKEYNIGKSIQTAKQKIAELQEKDINEFDRRAAQHAIAQSASQAVLGFGGSAEAAQQIRLGMAPPELDMKEAQLRATGKDTVAEATIALQKEQEAAAIRNEKRAQADKIQLKQMDIEAAKELAALKGVNKKDFGVQDKNTIAKSLEMGKVFNDTIARANKVSGIEFLSPEALSRDRRLFEITKKNAIDVLTRLRTGAALNESEERFYGGLISELSKGDVTPQRLIENVQAIKQGIRRTWESRIEMGEDSGLNPEILKKYKARGETIFGPSELTILDQSSRAPSAAPAASPPSPQGGGWMNFFKPAN